MARHRLRCRMRMALAPLRPRRGRWSGVLSAGLLLLPWGPLAAHAEGQVQLSCSGSLLEARGQAELTRPIVRLQANLSLEAEGRDADQALATLQRRLAVLRSTLQSLEVSQLRVSAPSTWQRPEQPQRPAAVEASLQVSGLFAPSTLQRLIRGAGALPGVRLSPVVAQADPAGRERLRQQLLRLAYDDALRQAQPLAELVGARRLRALEIRSEGSEALPIAMRAMAAAADAPAPFNPDELEPPRERLALQVRFCAQ